MYKKYVVRLTEEERSQLETLVRSGRAHARKPLYGRILLKADADGPDRWTDERIADALEVSTATVARERRRFLRGGAGSSVDAQEARQAKEKGARRASRGTPGGALLLGPSRGEGTLEHEVVSRSDGGAWVRGVALIRNGQTYAQKNQLKPHLKRQWVIPPTKNATFVWRMEEVLDLYEEPYDPLRPVVCFDERPCQLIGELRDPLPMKPGHIERFDSEYERGGVCWVFMSFEPLTGWREVVVTEHRRKQEFALAMRRLAEEHYPQAEKIRT